MSWLNKIPHTYLINLDKRQDRLEQSTKVLGDYGIQFERFAAIEKENGKQGIRSTLIAVFEDAIRNDYHNILVFEDDIEFKVAPEIFHELMDNALETAPRYDVLFLGANMSETAHEPYNNYLLHLKYSKEYKNIVVANHAMIYSKQGILDCWLALNNEFDRYGTTDMCIWHEVCSRGMSLALRPLVAVQRAGYSDIEKRVTDYEKIASYRK